MTVEVRRTLRIPVPPERVWAALTDPVQLSAWLEARVTLDAIPGAPLLAVDPDGAERRGIVEEAERPRRLVFRWRRIRRRNDGFVFGPQTRVELRVEETSDGSVLRLTERPLAGTSDVAPDLAQAVV